MQHAKCCDGHQNANRRRKEVMRIKMNLLVAQTWSLCQQLRSLLLLCKQMLMMGFPCADKQAVCPSLTPLHHFTRKHVYSFASHHFTDMTHIHVFFSSLVFVLFFVSFKKKHLFVLCSCLFLPQRSREESGK